METTPKFTLANARACLEASALAYDRCEINTRLAHARVVDYGEARILAFRGSASVRDFLTDGRCVRTRIGAGEEVHSGFLDALISIQKEIIEVGRCNRTLFVTGHSLGGALALLAAQVLERAGVLVMGVYTFGGPRVGNGAWARGYDGGSHFPVGGQCSLFVNNTKSRELTPTQFPLGRRTWRIVNEEDIVTRLPGWLMGYRHCGREVFLSSFGSMHIEPGLWVKLFSDIAGTYLDWKRGRLAQLKDHGCAGYATRMERLTRYDLPDHEGVML